MVTCSKVPFTATTGHRRRGLLALADDRGAVAVVRALGLAALIAAAPGTGWAQGAPGGSSSAAGSDLPRRRPEEAQPDPFRAFDINKDGVLNVAELKSAAAARFDELNPDNDDALDPREAAAAMTAELFREADTNGDGMVSKAEYLALVERLAEAADGDHDGTLNRAELANAHGQVIARLIGR